MAYSNFEGPAKIPNLATRKSAPMTTNFAKGVSTYKPNDTMGLDELRLAENARFDRVGEYGTRKGYQNLSATPLNSSTAYDGSTVGQQRYASGADIEVVSFTVPSTPAYDAIFSVVMNMRKATADSPYVVPKITLSIDGVAVSSACVDLSEDGTSAIDRTFYFMDAPEVSAGQVVSITLGTQSGSLSDLDVKQGLYASIPEEIWQTYMVVNGCKLGGISSVFEANIDGNRPILFVSGNVLYWRNTSGAVASIRTLPAGVSKVRFSQNLNEIRYVDGKEAPHKLVPTVNGSGVVTAWVDSAIPVKDLATDTTLNITMSNIMNGTADNLIYFAVDPDTEAVWTYPYGYKYAKSPAYSTTATIEGAVGTTLSININSVSPSGIAVGDWITGQGTGTAEVTSISGSTVNLIIVDTTPQVINSYDKFNVDFYQNFPAIKTGDPLTAMFNLGGVLYMMTRRNKYMMYAQTADSWSQSASNAQNGTFSQESVACDLNYAYYANDNGIYVFDGASESSLTESSIQNAYDAIPNKEGIVLDLFNNRLYCYYSDTAGQPNNRCFVYNINLRVWESFDSNAFVGATSARQNASGRFICGHSKIGLLMLNEAGDYADLSSPIAFNLETSYQHYGTTSQLKRIEKWRPEFAATDNPYTCECGYALDFTDQVHYAFSIDLQKMLPTVLDGYTWDNPSDYGVPAIPTVHTTIPRVNGEFYRCQIRYQHIAAFEPVIFRSHTLTVQTQRIR